MAIICVSVLERGMAGTPPMLIADRVRKLLPVNVTREPTGPDEGLIAEITGATAVILLLLIALVVKQG
jgi:hypothetical protein